MSDLSGRVPTGQCERHYPYGSPGCPTCGDAPVVLPGRGTTRLPFDGQASCDCKAMPVSHRMNGACMRLLDAQEGRATTPCEPCRDLADTSVGCSCGRVPKGRGTTPDDEFHCDICGSDTHDALACDPLPVEGRGTTPPYYCDVCEQDVPPSSYDGDLWEHIGCPKAGRTTTPDGPPDPVTCPHGTEGCLYCNTRWHKTPPARTAAPDVSATGRKPNA